MSENSGTKSNVNPMVTDGIACLEAMIGTGKSVTLSFRKLARGFGRITWNDQTTSAREARRLVSAMYGCGDPRRGFEAALDEVFARAKTIGFDIAETAIDGSEDRRIVLMHRGTEGAKSVIGERLPDTAPPPSVSTIIGRIALNY